MIPAVSNFGTGERGHVCTWLPTTLSGFLRCDSWPACGAVLVAPHLSSWPLAPSSEPRHALPLVIS